MQRVHVVGGGMAGCECALQLARRGIGVVLHEMRPVRTTEAHHTDGLAELVCSNSFRGDSLGNAVGLLKEEMRRAGGALMAIALEAEVPAGGAQAVDRAVFSSKVTEAVAREPGIEVVRGEIEALPATPDSPWVIATGPLTSAAMSESIRSRSGETQLYFYDAIAPIVDAESIDRAVVFAQSRYDKGDGDDYLNCPMSREEYEAFVAAVVAADQASAREFEEAKFFEACLPIEVMAGRGRDVLSYGPMKPVGLTDPRTGKRPWAVVQLRKENVEGTSYNLVGFQTRMKWGAQKEIFRTIPGLERAEFLRFGSVHRNTFVHGPKVLGPDLSLRGAPGIWLAGQITGVEGYVESMATGMLVGQLLAARLAGVDLPPPPDTTALGALRRHVCGELSVDVDHYQPTNINWGMMPAIERTSRRESRRDQRLRMAERSLASLEGWLSAQGDAGLRLPGFSRRTVEEARAEAD